MLFRRKATLPPAAPPPLRWGTVRETPGRFSSGVADLDGALGGGYRQGSVVALEADPSVGDEDSLLLSIPAIANFLAVGRGALVVPPPGIPSDRIRERLLRCVPAPTFDERVRVLDYFAVEPRHGWLVPMARYGRNEAMKAMLAAEKAVSGPGRGAFVEVSSLDTMERIANSQTVIRMFTHGLGRVKEVGNLAVVWIRGGSPAATAISGMADVILAMSRSRGRLAISGVRPPMPARAISWNESGGTLRVELGLAGDPPSR